MYITTVNMFLAQLNLSKQHTPSWAVKRADRETAERKNRQMRQRHTLNAYKVSLCKKKKERKKNSVSVFGKEQRKEGVRDRESRLGERERER